MTILAVDFGISIFESGGSFEASVILRVVGFHGRLI